MDSYEAEYGHPFRLPLWDPEYDETLVQMIDRIMREQMADQRQITGSPLSRQDRVHLQRERARRALREDNFDVATPGTIMQAQLQSDQPSLDKVASIFIGHVGAWEMRVYSLNEDELLVEVGCCMGSPEWWRENFGKVFDREIGADEVFKRFAEDAFWKALDFVVDSIKERRRIERIQYGQREGDEE